MMATFAVRPATCEPCTPHLAALRSLATRRGDADILREVEALERRVGGGSGTWAEEVREERLRFQMSAARRWLDVEARAFLAKEHDQLAPMLDGRLDALSYQGRRAHAAAARELRSLLGERLVPWRARCRQQAADLYVQLARRLRADPVPEWSPRSGLPLVLVMPTLFLDPGAVVRAVRDLLSSREEAWRRVRRRAQSDAEALLRANVVRFVDDLKDQLERALRSAAPAAR